MKKGKRKIIQRSTMFIQDNQQLSQQYKFSNNFSFDQDPLLLTPTNTSSINTQQILNNKQIKNYQHNIVNCNQQQQSKQTIYHKISSIKQCNQDLQKKKKLELLKLKYLKNHKNKQIQKQSTQSSNQPNNQSSHPNLQLNKLSTQSHSQQQLHVPKKYQQQNQSIIQKHQQQQKLIQNQTTISKSPIISIPPQPQKNNNQPQKKKNKKHAPPPPPPTIKNPIKQQQDKNLPQHRNNNIHNEFINSPNNQSSITENQPKHNKPQNYTQTKDPISSIRKWASDTKSQPNAHQTSQSQQIKTKILNELGNSQNIQQIILNFILSNPNPYSQNQSTTIQHLLTTSPSISPITKLLLLIKCGPPTLQKHKPTLNLPHSLEQLQSLQHLLLQNQKNLFIQFFLNNYQLSQSTLTHLFILSPHNSNISNLILNYQFTNINLVINILSIIKTNLTQKLCPLYFKLINAILPFIQDQQILQNILNLIAKITYQCAYQLKKDCKLRIIQKIDKITNTNTYQKPIIQNQNQQIKQDQKDKGFGMSNIMGYVNQTFKKITNQIPQRPPIQTQPHVDQTQESIVYDPVTKRYLINGKIPQDQNTHKQQQNTNKQKPTKKIPPPPPRPAPRPTNQPQSFPQNKKKYISQIHESRQPQKQQQIQNNIQKNNTPFPQPPARMGLKGMGHKKPKLYQRYV